MVTPFDVEGALDVDGAVTLARWLADHGSEALVLAGSTGEATALGDAEKRDLWTAVSEAVTVPVIAGAGTADTAHSIELARTAEKAGVAAVLAVTPYYSRPSQSGLEDHFRALAGATCLPVVLYDVPARTGRRLARETVLRLARGVPNVVALKDAGGDVVASARLLADAPEGFELYSGDDGLTLPLLAVGASGLIGVATHWAGPECAEMITAFGEGDLARAWAVQARLFDSFSFETGDEAPNPLPAKAMLRILGLPAGQCRPPLGKAPADLDHRARAVLGRLRRDGREAREGDELLSHGDPGGG